MTTEQLIEACASEGVTVSISQIGRWVREGLIPDSLRRRHGRGRGMGAEWLWDAECLPRAVLIRHALVDGDRSFRHAARVLAETGYAPAAAYLRPALLDCLTDLQQFMTKRLPYLVENRPQAEKHSRFTKHMRRKVADMPDSTFQSFAAFAGAILGVIPLDDPTVPDVMKQFQQFFSIPALQQRLETIDDATLLEKYEEVRRAITSLLPFVLEAIDSLALPLLRQQLEKKGQDTSMLPTSINPEEFLKTMLPEEGHNLITANPVIGNLRLFFSILLIAIPAENTELLIELSEMLLKLCLQLFDYFSIPTGLIVSLLKDAPSALTRSLPSG